MNIVLSFLFTLFSLGVYSQGHATISAKRSGYTVDNLPSPKVKGQDFFVSNPDGILSHSIVQELDNTCQKIEATFGVEYAIVVVDDYVGDNDFDFAFELFKKWGIGKADSNNGLLLFIAKNRREYRFISGYGVEEVLPDASLKRIGEEYLVPNFRNNNYSKGILEASNFIAEVLHSPSYMENVEYMIKK